MVIDTILVVGKNPQAQQLVQDFTHKLYAADEANDIWPLIDTADPSLIFFDGNTSHVDIHNTLERIQRKSCSPSV